MLIYEHDLPTYEEFFIPRGIPCYAVFVKHFHDVTILDIAILAPIADFLNQAAYLANYGGRNTGLREKDFLPFLEKPLNELLFFISLYNQDLNQYNIKCLTESFSDSKRILKEHILCNTAK